MTVDTSRFRTHLPPAAPQEPPGRRPAVRLRRLGLQTTPERIRALAAVAVLAIGGFYIVANIAIGNARDGLRVIGHDAGPQVLATGNLYYALGDMDSQVASILLSGSEPSPGAGQQELRSYSQDRATADRAALRPRNSPLAILPTRQRCARSWTGSGSTSGSSAWQWSLTSRRITELARRRAM